jgi:hypothetical protein
VAALVEGVLAVVMALLCPELLEPLVKEMLVGLAITQVVFILLVVVEGVLVQLVEIHQPLHHLLVLAVLAVRVQHQQLRALL